MKNKLKKIEYDILVGQIALSLSQMHLEILKTRLIPGSSIDFYKEVYNSAELAVLLVCEYLEISHENS